MPLKPVGFPSSAEGVSNPLTEDLDMGGFDVINSPSLFDISLFMAEVSSIANQEPAMQDVQFQINFGPGALGISDPAMIDSKGTITINRDGDFQFTNVIQIGRAGNPGVVFLIISYFLDGVQPGNTGFFKISSDDITAPWIYIESLYFTAGQEIELFILRSSDGVDEGGLFGYDPTVPGINNVVPAVIRLALLRGE